MCKGNSAAVRFEVTFVALPMDIGHTPMVCARGAVYSLIIKVGGIRVGTLRS